MANEDKYPLPDDFTAIKPKIPECWSPQPVIASAPTPAS